MHLVSNTDETSETRQLGKAECIQESNKYSSPASPPRGDLGQALLQSPHSRPRQMTPRSEGIGPLFPVCLQPPHQQILKLTKNICIIG